MSTRIAVLVGSLRKESYNRTLANAVIALAPEGFTFDHVRIDDLPPYNQDTEQQPGEAVTRLRNAIRQADGLLFATPEYNRSVSGVLKNAIDHASRPYGESTFTGKPAGVIGASIGAPGASMAQQHLRNILAYLDVPTLGQPEVFVHVTEGMFDASGTLVRDDTREFLQTWMDKYVEWVRTHTNVRG